MKAKARTENATITYEDTPEIRDKVFQMVLDFFLDYEAFSGESVVQNDEPTINAASVLGDIADFLKFKVKWKD